MSYIDLDPRAQTDFALDLSRLDLSLLAEVFEIEILAQSKRELQENCPHWNLHDVEYEGVVLVNGTLTIQNVCAPNATFDEDSAREAFFESENDERRSA